MGFAARTGGWFRNRLAQAIVGLLVNELGGWGHRLNLDFLKPQGQQCPRAQATAEELLQLPSVGL